MIEREFLELHERVSSSGKSQLYIKNLLDYELRDCAEGAHILEHASEISESLNKRLSWALGIRFHHFFTIKTNYRGVKGAMHFIDLGDFEQLQTNIIDPQKLYECIVVNNGFTTLA